MENSPTPAGIARGFGLAAPDRDVFVANVAPLPVVNGLRVAPVLTIRACRPVTPAYLHGGHTVRFVVFEHLGNNRVFDYQVALFCASESSALL